MPVYAGTCEVDITPPIGVAMADTGSGARQCAKIHDPLYARALTLDNGRRRLTIISADLFSLPTPLADDIRRSVASRIGAAPEAILVSCSGTTSAPETSADFGDAAYLDVLRRKLIGSAVQAAQELEPAYITAGEASAQIGIPVRALASGTAPGHEPDLAGVAIPRVDTLCVNGADGRLIAVVFTHACRAAAAPAGDCSISADWPGAAVQQLKARFLTEGADGGVRENAMPIFLAGCGADILPARLGSWESVREAGRQISDAVHAARWNAHGRQSEDFGAQSIMVQLQQDDGAATASLAVSCIRIGGNNILAFPCGLGARCQAAICDGRSEPIFCVTHANGYHSPFGSAFERTHRSGSTANGGVSDDAGLLPPAESAFVAAAFRLLDAIAIV